MSNIYCQHCSFIIEDIEEYEWFSTSETIDIECEKCGKYTVVEKEIYTEYRVVQ